MPDIKLTNRDRRILSVLSHATTGLDFIAIEDKADIAVGLVVARLAYLENAGLITSESEDGPHPGRRFYRLTTTGRARASKEAIDA